MEKVSKSNEFLPRNWEYSFSPISVIVEKKKDWNYFLFRATDLSVLGTYETHGLQWKRKPGIDAQQIVKQMWELTQRIYGYIFSTKLL